MALPSNSLVLYSLKDKNVHGNTSAFFMPFTVICESSLHKDPENVKFVTVVPTDHIIFAKHKS